MKTALHCAICLCALLLLSACGATRQPLTRTELVEVPVTAYAPLPPALTAPLPRAPAPPRNCRYRDGTPAVCALDGLLWIVHPQALLQRADEDRATSGRISTGGSLTTGDGRDTP